MESRETIHETIKATLELMYNQDLNYIEVCDFIPVNPIGDNEVESCAFLFSVVNDLCIQKRLPISEQPFKQR